MPRARPSRSAFSARAWSSSTPQTDADVVVVNTCTVTGEADAKARKAVRRALGAGAGGPVVVVTGCLAALDPRGLDAGSAARVVVEAGQVARGAPRGRDPRPGRVGRRATRLAGPRRREPVPGSARGSWSRCRTAATTAARTASCPTRAGAPRSVPAAEVARASRALAAAGAAEIVLTGINIGRYADGGTGPRRRSWSGSPRRASRASAISSIEPLDLTDELLETSAGTPAVMPHLHVPLQSGCDRRSRDAPRLRYGRAVRRRAAARPGRASRPCGDDRRHRGLPGRDRRRLRGVARLRRGVRRSRSSTSSATRSAPARPPRRCRGRSIRRSSRRERTPRCARSASGWRPATPRSRLGQTADAARRVDRGTVAHAGRPEDHLRAHIGAAGLRAGEVVRVRLLGVDDGRSWRRASCSRWPRRRRARRRG